ncbi:2593_t:CDS:2 [Scutellospora calospora]|uniref:2593_t:CDS:1 n=1 Tax=Scutellospora calospora TaxID=85575 RepID=A0ACA9MR80_9GLOM|nr:2593_t:CDS:2 [Scutellospora calospora]
MAAPQWNESQYKAYQGVMDAFHNYENLGGFFVGNEVLTSPDTDVAAPFVKAAARDMKAYRDADVATLRPMLQNYLACGEDTSDAVDFYGLNAYEWYAAKHPTHLHERIRLQHPNLLLRDRLHSRAAPNLRRPSGDLRRQDDSATAASGADAQYGRSGTPKPINPDFENLSQHWATLSPTGVRADDYKPSLTPPPCPDFTSGAWAAQPEESGDATAVDAESGSTASDGAEASPTSGASLRAESSLFPGLLLGFAGFVWVSAALMAGLLIVMRDAKDGGCGMNTVANERDEFEELIAR